MSIFDDFEPFDIFDDKNIGKVVTFDLPKNRLFRNPSEVNISTTDSPEIFRMKLDQFLKGKEFIEGEIERSPKLIDKIDITND